MYVSSKFSPHKVYRDLSESLGRKPGSEEVQLCKVSTHDTASIIVFGGPHCMLREEEEWWRDGEEEEGDGGGMRGGGGRRGRGGRNGGGMRGRGGGRNGRTFIYKSS